MAHQANSGARTSYGKKSLWTAGRFIPPRLNFRRMPLQSAAAVSVRRLARRTCLIFGAALPRSGSANFAEKRHRIEDAKSRETLLKIRGVWLGGIHPIKQILVPGNDE